MNILYTTQLFPNVLVSVSLLNKSIIASTWIHFLLYIHPDPILFMNQLEKRRNFTQHVLGLTISWLRVSFKWRVVGFLCRQTVPHILSLKDFRWHLHQLVLSVITLCSTLLQSYYTSDVIENWKHWSILEIFILYLLDNITSWRHSSLLNKFKQWKTKCQTIRRYRSI